MTGAELEAAIVDAAHLAGFRCAHFAPARTAHGWRTPCRYDARGFPDLVLTGPRVLFAEVKGDGDKLRPEQEGWLDALEAAGAETHVWTSDDWVSGRIDVLLGLTPAVA